MKVRIIFLIMPFVIISCKTGFNIQIYKYQPTIDSNISNENEIRKRIIESDVKSITLRNDSTLEYWKRYGGIGSLIKIRYFLINNELIIDSIDSGGNKNDLSNIHFLYSQDSLINRKTQEKYYNQKYIDKISKK